MYVLEIFCSSVGRLLYLSRYRIHIWKALKEDLINDPYHLVCYGERIILHEVEKHGKTVTVTWKGQKHGTSVDGILDDENDYGQEGSDSDILFEAMYQKDVILDNQDIIFRTIPLIVHLSLPKMKKKSPFPILPK